MSLIPQKILSVVMAKSYFIQGTERNRTLGGRDKELHHRLSIKEGLFVIEFTCVYMVTTYASWSLVLFIPTWRETPHNPLSPADATRRRCSQFSVVTTSSFSALTALQPPLHLHSDAFSAYFAQQRVSDVNDQKRQVDNGQYD